MNHQHFSHQFEIQWRDLDPNRHMRHSAYADYAAHMRLKIMEAHGLDTVTMNKFGFGPILFKEEIFYLREIGMEGKITATAALSKARENMTKWSFRHEIYRPDGIQAAKILVDGAWIDLKQRKIVAPPQEIIDVFNKMPRTEDFELIPPKMN